MASLQTKVILAALLGCLLVSVCLADQTTRPPLKDVIFLKVSNDGVVSLADDVARYIKDIKNAVRMVSFVGHVNNTNRMMHFVVDRPYYVEGPDYYGVEMWPRFFNISVPDETTLFAIHYDHDHSGFRGDTFVEAKLVAVMTLISSHMVYNHDSIQSRHPGSQWDFITTKRVPALVLRDIVTKRMPGLTKFINWPKPRSYFLSGDGSFPEFCAEHEFPEYLWPDLDAMFHTGRYGKRTVPCGSFLTAMTEDHNSYTTVMDKKAREIHHSETGVNTVKLIKGLTELVNGPTFNTQYKEALELLKVIKKNSDSYWVQRFGGDHIHLGGHPTPPTPLEPQLPPVRVGHQELYPAITTTVDPEHEEL